MQPQASQCWLLIANDSDFSLQNIPFGVVSLSTNPELKFPATRIGDAIINLQQVQKEGLFNGELFKGLTKAVFGSDSLNQFMALQRPYWVEARLSIQHLVGNTSPLKDNQLLRSKLMSKASNATNHLPAKIGDYTDFYSSKSHAFNIGSIIRGPANALNENWLHIPIGYHGRASSIVLSGTKLRRPRGQVKSKDATLPSFSECKRLDFQIQIGAFIGGTTNQLGSSIKINNAWNNVFGFVILNDWSFRDFQAWQYVPLGPFTAKNGMTTISPWIITLQALQGSQIQLPAQYPQPLKYLQQAKHISYDIKLNLEYRTPKMQKGELLIQTNYKHMYWSCAQQLTHHSVSGCNMQPGDLLGSGTISGDDKKQFGSLMELTWGGVHDINFINGETRKFIQDGDSILITASVQRNGQKIGFGPCEGTIMQAFPQEHYY